MDGAILVAAGLAVLMAVIALYGGRRLSAWWLPALLALPILAGLLWCFPSDDDWCYGAARQGSWWAAQASWYQGWSGRYAATAVLTAWGLADDPGWAVRIAYPATLAAIALAWPLALAWLLRELLPGIPVGRAALAAALVAGAALVSLPSISEGVFWLAGAATYQGGLAACLALLAALLAALRRGGGWRWAAATALALLAPGFSETLAAVVVPAALLAWWLHPRRRAAAVPALVVGAALAAGLAAVALAPGNAHRFAAMAAEGVVPERDPLAVLAGAAGIAARLLAALPWAVLAAGALAAGLVLAPWARGRWWGWLAAAVALPVVAALPMAVAGAAPPRAGNPLVVLVAAALALAIAAALRERVPAATRVRVLVLLAVAGALVAAAAPPGLGLVLVLPLAAIALVADRILVRGGVVEPATLAAALLLAVAPASPHWPAAWGDLVRAGACRAAQDRQLAVLAAAPAGARLGVPLMLLAEPPRLAWHGDLRVSGRAWANQGAAAFFALAEVRGLVASGAPAGR